MDHCAAYIPAKGTSVSVSYKNMVPVGNRPLVQIAIEFARELGVPMSRVVVSTESGRIGAFAQQCGATVWTRPPELSGPTATVREVLLNDAPRLLDLLGPQGLVLVLLPTSPFRRCEDVLRAVALLRQSAQAHALVSVSAYAAPVAYRLGLNADDAVLQFPEGDEAFNQRSRRQQHATQYYPDGALYAVRIASFVRDPRFFVAGKTLGLVSDSIARLDIDSMEDLKFARLIADRLESAVSDE